MLIHTEQSRAHIQSRARLALGASSMASFYGPTEGERAWRGREEERGRERQWEREL